MRIRTILSLLSFVFFPSFMAWADLVHVIEQTEVGGVTNVVSDATKLTGMPWATAVAPSVSGQIFTHWTISTKQDFSARDEWGRAFDSPSFMLYEDTALTAHYLSATQDSDGDGVADGYEIYWYGDLAQDAASDTDGDGMTLAEELAKGTNPLTPEVEVCGPIAFGDGDLLLYNPSNYASVKILSEPEGGLFATSEEWLRPGTYVETPSCSPSNTKFAYWTRNGMAVRDEWGRAADGFHLMMSTNEETLVAVTVEDYETRMKLYWYGRTDVAIDSDTDGDGLTFAEELANGTNPLTPENDVEGPITYADGDLLQYNPWNLQPYTIKSDPEGALFETIDDYAPFGTFVDAQVCSPNTSAFACWALNGVEQRDAWGRAVETISLQMGTNAQVLVAKAIDDAETRQKYYWYGTDDVAMDSDTDGDGRTFAEELAAGTNPLMAERHQDGPVTYADTQQHEINLQVYETVEGAIVDGAYVKLSGLGTNVCPIVQDLNGDGRFDMIVITDGATNVFVNAGSIGNPQFVLNSAFDLTSVDLNDSSLDLLAGLTLDVEPIGALSATTNGNTLLVSDVDGRIWYYAAQTLPCFTLQHKVWGGSYPGFADGLRISAVDWEGDGDLDCLCGTADGQLVLLRNPKVGRPTNVRLYVGADNVLLTWDPNTQSRIRGYRVYRDNACVASPTLPTYRDTALSAGDHGYEISSVSRFYVTGSSTPIVSESMRTVAVTATVGRVAFFWNDVNCREGEQVEVLLSIENSLNFNVAGTTQTVTFDPTCLTFVKVGKTGITENLGLDVSCADGRIVVRITSGALNAGTGKFLTFLFEARKAGVTQVGDATVVVEASACDATDVPRYSPGDIDGDGEVGGDDVRLLAELVNGAGRSCSSEQLKAGDFNGNGKLDQADYQALREIVKSSGKEN